MGVLMKVLDNSMFQSNLHQIILQLKYIKATQLIIITAQSRLKVSHPKDATYTLIVTGKEEQ